VAPVTSSVVVPRRSWWFLGSIRAWCRSKGEGIILLIQKEEARMETDARRRFVRAVLEAPERNWISELKMHAVAGWTDGRTAGFDHL
jgi:hypothetical protein